MIKCAGRGRAPFARQGPNFHYTTRDNFCQSANYTKICTKKIPKLYNVTKIIFVQIAQMILLVTQTLFSSLRASSKMHKNWSCILCNIFYKKSLQSYAVCGNIILVRKRKCKKANRKLTKKFKKFLTNSSRYVKMNTSNERER